MRDKRGTANGSAIFMWVIGIGFVLALYQMGAIPGLNSARGGGGGTTGTGGMIQVNVTGNTCNVDSTILTLGNVEDHYNGNKLTAWYHRWYLQAKGGDNFVDQGYVLDGTTRTVSPYDKIRIYYNVNGSATSHYPAFAEFEVPCSGAFTAATADSKYKDAYKLYNMTRAADVTFTVNNVNGAVNSASAPQILTAGQVRKMKFQIDFPNKAAYGAIKGPDGSRGSFLAICQWNSTYFDDFTLASGKAKYTGQLPIRVKINPDFAVSAYEFDAAESNSHYEDLGVLDGDDTIPATSTNSNVNCTLVDKSWYVPTNSNIPAFGYETDTQTDVGTVDLSFLFRTNGTG